MKLRWVLCLFFCFISIAHTADSADDPSPIIIGATVSMEGKYEEPSKMIQEAFHFWVDEVNQKGGLLGRKVKLILYDDKSDKERTKLLYKRLIEQDKVDLVFSPYSTPLTLVASDVSEQHEMMMLAVAAAAEAPWQRGARYLFQLYAPAKRQFIGLMDMMAKKNLKSLAVLYDETSAFNLDIVKGIEKWATLFKIDIVYRKGYREGQKELPALIAEVKTKNANGLVLSAYPPDSYELLRLLREMDYRPTVLGMPIVPAHPDFYKKVGDMADRTFGPSQWEPDERIPFPGTRRFVESFTQFTGHLPSFHAASAYSACKLYEKAISHTQSIENGKLCDYIATLDTVTVLGRFKVDSSGKQVGHNSFIIQWQNGKKEIVWPQKMQTAQPIF
jgi:branched-chain amino acid transport system substrate-binding protein